MQRPARVGALLLAALLLTGGAAWALWPEDEPEVEQADGDTGLSIEAQERLAFEIGYLKQQAPPSGEQ